MANSHAQKHLEPRLRCRTIQYIVSIRDNHGGLDRKMRYAPKYFCLHQMIDTTHSGIAAGP